MKDDNFIFTEEWSIEAADVMPMETFIAMTNGIKVTHDIKFLFINSGTTSGSGFHYVTFIMAIREKKS